MSFQQKLRHEGDSGRLFVYAVMEDESLVDLTTSVYLSVAPSDLALVGTGDGITLTVPFSGFSWSGRQLTTTFGCDEQVLASTSPMMNVT